jgi:hypothetical protein
MPRRTPARCREPREGGWAITARRRSRDRQRPHGRGQGRSTVNAATPHRIGGVIVVGAILLAGSLAACAKTVGGSAHYAAGAPAMNLPLVKLDALPGLMPTAAEAVSLTKSPQLATVDIYTEMQPLAGASLSDPNCVGAVFGIEESVYRGSDYQGVYGQLAGDPTMQTSLRVDEGVVAFGSAEDAQSLVSAQTRKWQGCTAKTLTVKVEDQQVNWIASGPTVSDGVPVLLRTQQNGQAYSCSHAMAARSNIVADVGVCSDDKTTVNDQAAAVVNTILGKIPG